MRISECGLKKGTNAFQSAFRNPQSEIEWLTRPGFTNKLGANWVEVTKAVFRVERSAAANLHLRAMIENEASNTRS